MTATTASRVDTRQVVAMLPVPPQAPGPVTHVRSTLVTSSLRTLQEQGLIDRYYASLAPVHRETIRGTIAGVWLPVDMIVAHYRACDALALTPAQQLQIGRAVGEKIQGTLLGTLVSLAKQAGASPWTFLEKLDRLYERLVIGGGIVIVRAGPKDAVVELLRIPLFDIPYFATAWRGVIQGMCELFCTKAYVKSGRLELAASKMTYTISWA